MLRVKIESNFLKKKEHHYDYHTLTGEMLNVDLKIKYKNTNVNAHLDFKSELNYPLMYISSIE